MSHFVMKAALAVALFGALSLASPGPASAQYPPACYNPPAATYLPPVTAYAPPRGSRAPG